MANIDLFSRRAKDIQLEDVLAFIGQRYEENVRLDYKADFSSAKELAKDLAAFANTQGGILLIGVEEERGTTGAKSKPKIPVLGRQKLKPKEDSEVRVRDVALNPVHIWPPVLVDVNVYPMQDQREVILVQVIPDDELHWTENRTGFYIRDYDRCIPVPGSADDMELLRNKREKVLAHRSRFFDEAVHHFNTGVLFADDGRPPYGALPVLFLSATPTLPTRQLIQANDLRTLAQWSETKYEGYIMPPSGSLSTGAGQLRVIITTPTREELNNPQRPLRLFEAHTNGFLFYGRAIDEERSRNQSFALIPDHDLLCMVICFLRFALRVYREVGYLGLVQFAAHILIPHRPTYLLFQGAKAKPHILDASIRHVREFAVFGFDERGFYNEVVEFYRWLVWSGGMGTDVQEHVLHTKVQILLDYKP